MIDAFLGKLTKVKPAGKNAWRAVCPACGGQNGQKLSVRVGDTGAILLKCWAGCRVDEIVGAVGMSVVDLFPARDHSGRPQRGAFRYEALRELAPELNVAWVLLNDIANGRTFSAADRVRARECAHKASHLLAELR